MEAAREGHEDVVALLINQGNCTIIVLVLHWSVCSGANINAQTDETQETALTLACCGGFLEVVQLLAEKGLYMLCASVCGHTVNLLVVYLVTYDLVVWLMIAPLALTMWWSPGRVRVLLCWIYTSIVEKSLSR